MQAHLNDANEEVTELKQMLEEAGEAFTEKEVEISKLKAALDEEEACIKKQVGLARNTGFVWVMENLESHGIL